MVDSLNTSNLYDRLQSEVHVWYCQPPLIKDQEKLSEYKNLLSKQEIEQYHRFHYESDRHSYLVSHALLRRSLSKYTDIHASLWQFLNNEHGKPQLAASSALTGICFNLTHTEGLAACVVALDRTCGIDAEYVHRKNDLRAIAQRMFADEEVVRLNDSTLSEQFYYYWTLREAYVKALGTGLAGSSKEFYFDIDNADLSVQFHQKNTSYSNDESWRFKLYEPTPEHVLAVGFQSQDEVQVLMTDLTP